MAVSVLLDGRVVGEVSQAEAAQLALKLRTLKALGKENVRREDMRLISTCIDLFSFILICMGFKTTLLYAYVHQLSLTSVCVLSVL